MTKRTPMETWRTASAGGINERVVDEVLSELPVEITMKLVSAEIAIVGPDRGGKMWTLLLDWSFKRGDWLRPITGWPAEPEEIREWKRARGIQG
ncbi:MAG TPA: hypothetical protein VLB67_00650 [Acidimicrobiia bacterium]|nr:hypothetical protein [Acidimicrobiia bacterium]